MRKSILAVVMMLLLMASCLSVALYAQQSRPPAEIIADIEKLIAELKASLQPVENQPVQPGASITAAINAAPDSGTVFLLSGTTYTENVRITRSRVRLTTRKSASSDANAVIQSTSNSPAVDITGSDVTVEQLTLHGTATTNDLLLIGHGDSSQTSLAQVPNNVSVIECLIEGVLGTKNAIGVHGSNVLLSRNRILSPGRTSQETHGVIGWNGPGPVAITQNYIEATSIGIMFGGSDPAIAGLVPSDILIEGNTITKDLARRGQGLVAKNHIELKAGRRVTIRGNRLRHSWLDGQQAYSILFTPSQYGSNPGVSVEDVLVEANEILDTGSGFQIMGNGQNSVTAQTRRIAIRNNWLRTNRTVYGGQGWPFYVLREPADLSIENNTIEMDASTTTFMEATGGPVVDFRFVGNCLGRAGQYGMRVYVAGTMQNNATRWPEHFPGGVISGGGYVGSASALRTNLPSNLHLTATEGAGLIVDGYCTGALAAYGRQR